MCARHPRGFRRLARFAPRVSEVLPGLRDPVYAHRLFACRTRIMAESPCQGKSDSTYGLINKLLAAASSALTLLEDACSDIRGITTKRLTVSANVSMSTMWLARRL